MLNISVELMDQNSKFTGLFLLVIPTVKHISFHVASVIN
jgi:hypothetical protein